MYGSTAGISDAIHNPPDAISFSPFRCFDFQGVREYPAGLEFLYVIRKMASRPAIRRLRLPEMEGLTATAAASVEIAEHHQVGVICPGAGDRNLLSVG